MTTSTTARKPARKTATKMTAAPHRAPSLEEGGVELDTSRPTPPPDHFPIFRIDGVQYYAATNPAANVELRYLRLVRTQGPVVANAFLIEAMVGAEGYEALMNYNALTREDVARITRALMDAIAGAQAQGPKDGLSIG